MSSTVMHRYKISPSPHSDLVVWSVDVLERETYFTLNLFSSLGGVSEAPIVIRISLFSSVLVNFIAFVMRFISTWRTLLGSSKVHSTSNKSKELSSIKVRLVEARFSSASNIFSAERTRRMGWLGSGDTRRRFESRRERVSMSSIMRFWCMAQ